MITATSIELKKGLDTTITLSAEAYSIGLWVKADDIINEWSKEITSGYEDIDFTITFADDLRYSGTLEVGNPSITKNKALAEHIKNYSLIYSGRKCPAHWSTQQYQDFLAVYSKKQEEYEHLLDTYQLG